MTKTAGLLVTCFALTSATAQADISLNSVRVVADPEGNRIELIQPARR
jgi:hypothetical protein